MNLTNPKVAIFFLAFLPQFTSPEAGTLGLQLMSLGGIFIVVALIIFSLIAVLADFISQGFKQSNKAQQLINKIAGGIFLGLALKLAYTSR